jgi:hypothetical protein
MAGEGDAANDDEGAPRGRVPSRTESPRYRALTLGSRGRMCLPYVFGLPFIPQNASSFDWVIDTGPQTSRIIPPCT